MMGVMRRAGSVDLRNSPGFPILVKVMAILKAKKLEGYLVGGYLRDILLDRPTADIDVAIAGLELDPARQIANELDGKFVLLDELHKIARIVLKQDGDQQWHLDLTALRGDVEQDLAKRDFTINSLAAPLGAGSPSAGLLPLIDPLGGMKDLNSRTIRASSAEAFRADPVRLLRAIRFATELGFEIEPGAEELIKDDASRLHRASPERLRTELVRILEVPRTSFWFRYMDKVGLLGVLFPELNESRNVEQPKEHYWDVFNHSLETVGAAERLLTPEPQRAKDDLLASVPWSADISSYFSRSREGGSSRAALLKLAALLHDVAKPRTRTREGARWRFLGHAQEGAATVEVILENLRFSGREIETVTAEVRHHLRPGQLHHQGLLPTRRAIYRYYRDTGDVALDTLFLSLADHLAARGPSLDRQDWENHCQVVSYLLEQRKDEEKIVSPPRLIDGHDLMAVLGMQPGPEIGRILEEVREAQASGEVTSRDEALAFARKRIIQGD